MGLHITFGCLVIFVLLARLLIYKIKHMHDRSK